MADFHVHHGDCLEVLRGMADNSVDAIVTDPPYGLSFMGKRWDYDVPSVEIWAECLRVLKPGGHLLAFAGTRTQHRMAVRIEDAGFEIRDMIAWLYGSGFPKSLDVSKALDKAAGAERYVVGRSTNGIAGGTGEHAGAAGAYGFGASFDITEPATDAARQWQGWGTALKPALEPITVARKPLTRTVAENVLAHGTGALNIDGCRVGAHGGTRKSNPEKRESVSSYGNGLNGGGCEQIDAGRWPANVIHDGSEEVLQAFPQASGAAAPVTGKEPTGHGFSGNVYGSPGQQGRKPSDQRDGGGSAARFYYCAKASKRDRDEGLEGRELAKTNDGRKVDADNAYQRGATLRANTHPTVKPTDLMRYLCRLVTPPGGTVLDPFTGSGSTGKAAVLEGFSFIGIERDAEYVEIARARIAAAQPRPKQGAANDAAPVTPDLFGDAA